MLEIKNLHVNIEGKEILKGIDATFEKGKVHALMGPNGSGKSTLANILMGHPSYEITSGQILLNGEDITHLEANEKAQKGLFLSFQYPQEIPGLKIKQFLRTIVNNKQELLGKPKYSLLEFKRLLEEKNSLLAIKPELLERYLNQGFSGGEKKRCEILQMALLEPHVAILDETDSGLDIDALKAVSDGINKVRSKDNVIIIITHYKRILEYIHPDTLTILIEGKIRLTGDGELVDKLEEKGYTWIDKE